MPVPRVAALVAATVVAAAGLTVAGALATSPGPDPAAVSAAPTAGGGNDLERLQDRLRRVPTDWQGWAALGAAYVEQARATADPAFYAKAEDAFSRSLQIEPDDNADALTGQAALAAARHDFTAALALAERSERVDSFNPAALAVKSDALVELGRYDEAFAAIDRLNAMKPGLAAYARASYAWELRGEVDLATEAMELALDAAATPAQASFAAGHLGQLAFGSGDLDAAEQWFAEGLRRDPGAAGLLAGRARVAAARGDTAAALRDYTASVEAAPDPAVLAELGDLYATLGRDAEAQQQYDVVAATQRLLAAAGQDVDLELALFDADHGRPAEALAAARAAYERRRSIHTEDALAWALHRSGQHAEALPHAEAALRLGTRDAWLHYHLGMVRAALGDTAGARAALGQALELNPHFSPLHAPLARAELDRLGG